MTKGKPLSEEQRKKKNEKDRDRRAKTKGENDRLQKLEEKIEEFCKEWGIAEEFKAFCKKPEEKEDGADQHSDEGIREILKNSSKCEFTHLQNHEELIMEFCVENGITEKFIDFCEKREEQQRKYCEELGMVSEAMEDGANQHSDKGIRKILKNSSKNPLATLEENLVSEMIQTGGLEGVTAANSSSLGAMGTPLERPRELKRKGEELDGASRGKRPASAYGTTPSPLPIGGLMVDARWNYGQSVATQGPPLSTKKGTQIQMREATHDREASTSSWAPPPHHELGVRMYHLVKEKKKEVDNLKKGVDNLKKEADNLNRQVKELEEGFGNLKAELAGKGKIYKDALDLQMIDAVTLGWNLMKELLRFMQPGSEFLNMRLLDAFQLYPPLQNQYEEGLTLIGQGHPIEDKVAIQSDDPPVVGQHSSFWFDNRLERDAEWLSNGFAPQGDAANSSQFQAANARANNVEQEDNANDQRMNEATEAGNLGLDGAA